MNREEKIAYLKSRCSTHCSTCPICPLSRTTESDAVWMRCEFDKYCDESLDAVIQIMQGAEIALAGCEAESVPDAIHPSHYKLPNGMQVIDVEIALFGKDAVKEHCLCTAAEYILRHKGKNGSEDIRKAQWWINKYVEMEDGL